MQRTLPRVGGKIQATASRPEIPAQVANAVLLIFAY